MSHGSDFSLANKRPNRQGSGLCLQPGKSNRGRIPETGGTAQTSISDVRADVIYTAHDDNWGNIHGRMFKDLTDEELPDHDIYYQDDIRIIHAMDDSIDIGLE